MSEIIDFHETSRILSAARNLIGHLVDPASASLKPWEPPLKLDGKTGGCLCVTDHKGHVYLKAYIGKVPKDKLHKYWTFAEEKANRLSNNIPISRHVSSWQSRNTQYEQWGGAIKTPRHIYSFSGFPELYDEAFMLVLACELSHLSVEDAQAIAVTSANVHWHQLAKGYRQLVQ